MSRTIRCDGCGTHEYSHEEPNAWLMVTGGASDQLHPHVGLPESQWTKKTDARHYCCFCASLMVNALPCSEQNRVRNAD